MTNTCHTELDIIDKFRPSSPNVLTVRTVVDGDVLDGFYYFWELKDAYGDILGGSAYDFGTKDEAMDNALDVVGPGLVLGHHVVNGEVDKSLLAQALERLES